MVCWCLVTSLLRTWHDRDAGDLFWSAFFCLTGGWKSLPCPVCWTSPWFLVLLVIQFMPKRQRCECKPLWFRPNPCQFFHFQPSRTGRSFGPFSLNIQPVLYGFGGSSWGPAFLTNTCCHPSLFQLTHFSHCVWWRGVKPRSVQLGACTMVGNIKANSPLTILSAGEEGGATASETKGSRTAISQLSQCQALGGWTAGDSWVYESGRKRETSQSTFLSSVTVLIFQLSDKVQSSSSWFNFKECSLAGLPTIYLRNYCAPLCLHPDLV